MLFYGSHGLNKAPYWPADISNRGVTSVPCSLMVLIGEIRHHIGLLTFLIDG